VTFVNDGSRRTALVLGAVTAAAGIAAISYVVAKRLRSGNNGGPARSVSEVLNECYTKMREIQGHLAELGPNLQSATGQS
jgi:hypothetical protein